MVVSCNTLGFFSSFFRFAHAYNTIKTASNSVSDFGSLDLEDLFADCYYDVPGLNSLANPITNSTLQQQQNNNHGESIPQAAADVPVQQLEQQQQPPAPVESNSAPPFPPKKRPSAFMDHDDHDDYDDDNDGKSGEVMTEKQKIERRERNREHAKRSRLRKKFLLESLQEQIHGLQEQLEKFKDTLRSVAPQQAEQLIDNICGNEKKYTPLPMPSGFGPVKTLMEPDFRLMSALSGSQQNFAISDPTLPDNPIVYVSQGFLDLTGYQLDQVLGRNCRFLQGPGTDQSAVDVIRKGIAEGIDTSVCLLNYKADGTPFWNQFFVAALRDAENNVVKYVGVQCEVSKAVVEKHMGK
jgi:PAS domain S-box-containing protein